MIMKNKWSSLLTREKISDFIIDEAVEETKGKIASKTLKTLLMECAT
jgi:hypothetical protein